MKKASLVVNPPYLKSEIFNTSSYLNQDDRLMFFVELREEFARYNISLDTQDVHGIKDADYVLYFEMPKKLPDTADFKKSSILLWESELIRPDNWDLEKHKFFSKIFTWHDGFVDNLKYFKSNFTHTDKRKFLNFSDKTKFCTLIAGNKQIDHPLELYSKRIEAIQWFQENEKASFDFYGVGWDLRSYTFQASIFGKILNRMTSLRRLLSIDKYPAYRGKVSSKLDVLSQYKFSICYENARDIPGYITEKIFDSFLAGCIPIYWGAKNITEYVPADCFIDRTKFHSYEELFEYMSHVSQEEYEGFQGRILNYLSSDLHSQFESKASARGLVRRLIEVIV